jgi:hypothetical protein
MAKGLLDSFTRVIPSGINTGGADFLERRQRMDERKVREEDRKIRFLRLLVDLSIGTIQQDNLSLEEAIKIVEDLKRAACNLFPGKEEVFELIYRPRFLRIIQERFGLISSEKSSF